MPGAKAYSPYFKRSADNTLRFIVQLADNMIQLNSGYGCPQVSVDGFSLLYKYGETEKLAERTHKTKFDPAINTDIPVPRLAP